MKIIFIILLFALGEHLSSDIGLRSIANLCYI